MAYDKKPKSFFNPFFAKLVWWEGKNEGVPPPNVLIGLGIKKLDDKKNNTFYPEFDKLPVSDSGFVNITLGSNKGDKLKLSATYEATTRSVPEGKANSSYAANNTPSKPVEDDDSLPF